MNPLLISSIFLCITSILSSQNINQEIQIENQQAFMVGEINIDGLNSNSYQNWYTDNHEAYKVNTGVIEPITDVLSKHKILLFMGTWCGDSKREVPRFIKILETANFPMENLKIVAVDRRKNRYKKSPTGEEWGLSIKRVPTFIFYKDGTETNRIIESPIESLEEDIKAVVTNAAYTPNYPKSLHFD